MDGLQAGNVRNRLLVMKGLVSVARVDEDLAGLWPADGDSVEYVADDRRRIRRGTVGSQHLPDGIGGLDLCETLREHRKRSALFKHDP